MQPDAYSSQKRLQSGLIPQNLQSQLKRSNFFLFVFHQNLIFQF